MALAPSSIMDVTDRNSAGGGTVDFFFLAGDANHNRTVEISDFWSLASNFNKTGATYGHGDFNLDGKVNALDFNILASNYGARLSPPAAAPLAFVATAPAAAIAPTLFSADPIPARDQDLLSAL